MPHDEKTYMEVIPSSSTNIQCINDDYLKDEAMNKKKAAKVGASLVVNIETLPVKVELPTLSIRP